MLFVVAGQPQVLIFFVEESILNAICGVPEHFEILLFAFDARF